MADEATTTTPEAETPKADEYKAPASQADFDKIVETRLARERAKYADYDQVKADAAEYRKAQEASKTEIQKAVERAEKAEAERTDAIRESVAVLKGIDPTQAKRLVGATREELMSDADELLKSLAADGKKAPRARDQKQTETIPKEDPVGEFADNLFGVD